MVLLNKTHVIEPKIIPQITIERKLRVHSKYVLEVTIHHSRITHKITKNNATAVQSLKRLSHSKSIVNLLGAQSDLNIANTATGSVEDIKTQNNKQTKKGISSQINGNAKNNQKAIKNHDISNQNTANHVIAFQFKTNCL